MLGITGITYRQSLKYKVGVGVQPIFTNSLDAKGFHLRKYGVHECIWSTSS